MHSPPTEPAAPMRALWPSAGAAHDERVGTAMTFATLLLGVVAFLVIASFPPRQDVVLVPPPAAAHEASTVSTVPGFQHTCTGTASRIQNAANDTYSAIWVWNGTNGSGASSTPVFVGDSTVTTTLGMPLCSGNCPRADQSYESRGLWCITGGSSVAITAQVARP